MRARETRCGRRWPAAECCAGLPPAAHEPDCSPRSSRIRLRRRRSAHAAHCVRYLPHRLAATRKDLHPLCRLGTPAGVAGHNGGPAALPNEKAPRGLLQRGSLSKTGTSAVGFGPTGRTVSPSQRAPSSASCVTVRPLRHTDKAKSPTGVAVGLCVSYGRASSHGPKCRRENSSCQHSTPRRARMGRI